MTARALATFVQFMQLVFVFLFKCCKSINSFCANKNKYNTIFAVKAISVPMGRGEEKCLSFVLLALSTINCNMSRLKQWGFISINDEWVLGTIQNVI